MHQDSSSSKLKLLTMKNILTIVFALITAIGFAQKQPHNPSERIQQEKTNGTVFENVDLFTTVNKQKSKTKIPSELKDYTLFSFDKGKEAAFKSKAPVAMTLTIPGQKKAMSLELVKTKITTDDYQIIEMPSGKIVTPDNNVLHYRGIVKGVPNSVVAISFLSAEISGIISIGEKSSNLVIGKLKNSSDQIIYEDKDIRHLNDFVCRIEDNPEKNEQLQDNTQDKAAVKCPKIFFDIANDIVRDKGGAQGASDFIEAIFNQVSVLYANDDISIRLSGVKAWTSAAPFDGLTNYRNYRNRNSFNGDLGHFVTYNFSGGVAWVNALCGSYKYAVSGIRKSFSNVPTYSWSVEVVAHELGHNLGSPHTQACKWNNNNTAIDGCYGTEGGCARPGLPSGGGTIMSYCHLTNVGINFNKGFGPQPKALIQRTINSKSCVQTCDGGPGNDGSVTFQGNNNRYISSENGSNPMTCNRTVVRSFEKFTVVDAGGGQVALKGNNGRYVSSENGGAPMTCNRTRIGSWEKFTIVDAGGGKKALKGNNGKYVSSENGGAPITCNRTRIGSWEKFTINGLRNNNAIPQVAGLQNEIAMFPNPVKNLLTITMGTFADEMSKVLVKDINGRTLQSTAVSNEAKVNGVQVLDLSNMVTGVYFVQITNSNTIITQKVFIE